MRPIGYQLCTLASSSAVRLSSSSIAGCSVTVVGDGVGTGDAFAFRVEGRGIPEVDGGGDAFNAAEGDGYLRETASDAVLEPEAPIFQKIAFGVIEVLFIQRPEREYNRRNVYSPSLLHANTPNNDNRLHATRIVPHNDGLVRPGPN